MDRIKVRGGIPLRGTLPVGGSKNASLAIMAACLLVRGKTTLHNVPDIRDIHTMSEILQEVGAEVRSNLAGTVEIDATHFSKSTASEAIMRKMRASFYVLGPMLARLGKASVTQPGGCEIGARPVDFHIKGMQALGAHCNVTGGHVEAWSDGLKGCRIYFDFPSAGATTHLMTAASLASGVTTIENAAAEPEVADLGHFLQALGVHVEGAGTSTVTVWGTNEILTDREYTVIPDRMEAGTFACAAAITRGDVVLHNVTASHLQPVIVKLREMGVEVTVIALDQDKPGDIRIRADRRLDAVDVLAMPHPGFPTDMQQPMVALLAMSRGAAIVTDRVFENRFRFVNELLRMGANIRVDGRSAWVLGVEKLSGSNLNATDLRAGAALIVAALGAEGESVISGVEHVDRGYSALVEKLQAAGADIQRVRGESSREQVPV